MYSNFCCNCLVPTQNTGSSLCLTFALENFVDFLSSVAVLWRFFAPFTVDAELEEKLHRREKRASMGISFVLILLGIAVFFGAVIDYAQKEDDPDKLNAIVGVSFVSLLIFGFLSVFKFHYANILESPSLYKDGLCSLIGTILSGTLFINTLLIKQAPSIWWVDPTVAMFCGFGALFLGASHVHKARNKEKLPVFTLDWWFTSQGTKHTGSGHGETEMAGRKSSSSPKRQGDLV
jgi:divalent metal cation (Fe/Co/Zn/Cd) transporter